MAATVLYYGPQSTSPSLILCNKLHHDVFTQSTMLSCLARITLSLNCIHYYYGTITINCTFTGSSLLGLKNAWFVSVEAICQVK